MPGFKPSAKAKVGGKAGSGKLSGGHWVTIHGHPAYIKEGKVVAGGFHGVTHDAKGKPTGHPAPIDKEHEHLARAHVVKGLKAERIKKNAPGKDTSGVDHGQLKAAIEKGGGSYSHGAPKSRADHEHLAEAERRGGTAVKVTKSAKVWTESGRGGTRYHAGHELGIARVSGAKNGSGKYEVHSDSGVQEHRTLRGAHKAARKEAGEHAKALGRTTRLVVKGGDPTRRADAIDGAVPLGDRTHHVKVHVIHRGRGSSTKVPGSAFRPKH